MNDASALVLAWAAGTALGAIFFGGLWWTVRRGVSSKQPVFWFCGSLLLRVSIVLPGFYWIGRAHWERMLMSLAGFIMARLIVTSLTRPSTEEVRHAPHSR